MADQKSNIFPIFDEILSRSEKEKLLKQNSCVIWFTGLSGSGKTTIAKWLEKALHKAGFLTQLLDGDNIRMGISNNLTFSSEDRKENIRRIAEISKLFINSGVITINCFVSPSKEIREVAREIIGANDFHEIFINTPLEVCEERDVKGLYEKARKGLIKDFTGIDAPYEIPETPALEIRTNGKSAESCGQEILNFILPKISRN